MQLQPIGWRAWFTKNRVYDSKTTTPEQLPNTECLIIIQYYENNYRDIFTGDWFIWSATRGWNRVRSTTHPIPHKTWATKPIAPIVIRGIQVSDSTWIDIQRKALESKWP